MADQTGAETRAAMVEMLDVCLAKAGYPQDPDRAPFPDGTRPLTAPAGVIVRAQRLVLERFGICHEPGESGAPDRQHHPDTDKVLAGLGQKLRGQVLTTLTRGGLEVGLAGSNLIVLTAQAERDEIAYVLADLLADPCEANLTVARWQVRKLYVMAALDRRAAGKSPGWLDQIAVAKEPAA